MKERSLRKARSDVALSKGDESYSTFHRNALRRYNRAQRRLGKKLCQEARCAVK